MKSFLELVEARYSSRSYSDRAVEPEKVEYLLECARLAPSAVNFQPWKFVVVESAEKRARLQECYLREWFREAPLYVVVCADKAQSWKRKLDGHDHADIDAAIATEHICLAATELGLGSCWVCNFDADLCSEVLDLEGELYPVAIVPIGYPTDEPTSKKRKPIEDVVSKV
ncbi:MAG: nitroreductase family protein [Alistipes sp.]|nr:nitroreductase family protein [Alistipes sp.]MBQ3246640.1 nitroreductase family protein [Alistipes sp.]MBQ4126482.1 nitroreductase family protein [Alistipes sp.]